MRPWTKSDFVIKGRRTHSNLRGRENEFIYEIFWEGQRLGDLRFTSYRKANSWLGKFIKKRNLLLEAYLRKEGESLCNMF